MLCFAAGGWVAATANAPDTAMPMLRFVAWSVGTRRRRVAGTGVRGVELGDVGLQTVAGPTSVLEATAIACSVAVSVASQSPGWANTSNQAPVPVFCSGGIGDKRSSEMQSEHRSNRAHSDCRSPWLLRVPCHVVTAVTCRVTPETTSPRPLSQKETST